MSLQHELEYFKLNQAELLREYGGKFLVIKDQKVIKAYDTEIQAYMDAKESFELGTFLIQHCMPGDEGFSQTYHSRVTFV